MADVIFAALTIAVFAVLGWVVQAVERTTKGCCSPTEGTVYPMLNEFEAGGYLTSHVDIVQGRERKVYAITRKGREAFQTAVGAWLEATDCIIAGKAAADALARRRGKARSSGG